MHINLEVMMHIAGSKIMRSGTFEVNIVDYKKDPDWTAAVTAYQFVQKNKYDTGYHYDSKVLKVIYNGDKDITDLVKKVKPAIQDDLPF